MISRAPSVAGSSLHGFFQGAILDRLAIRTIGGLLGLVPAGQGTVGFAAGRPSSGGGTPTLGIIGVPGAVELKSTPVMAVLSKKPCAQLAFSPGTIFRNALLIA
jgi:hypothetical protein